MLRIFSLNNKKAILTGESIIGGILFLSHFWTPYLLFDTLWFTFHLLINCLHHLQKLLLGEYPFLHEQSGKGFLLDHLGHEEFFKGNDLFWVKWGCHRDLPKVLFCFIATKVFE